MADLEGNRRRNAVYRERNRESIRARGRDYYHAHKEEAAAHYQENREEIRARQRAYNAENAERNRQRAMDWYYAHPEQAKEARKSWRMRNSEKARAMVTDWVAGHPDRYAAMQKAGRARRRALIADAHGAHNADDVARLMREQDGRCFWCGESVGAYHVDHVIPLSRGGSNGPENIVISCPTCNLKKGAKLPEEFVSEVAHG